MKLITIKSEKYPSLEKIADVLNTLSALIITLAIGYAVYTGKVSRLFSTKLIDLTAGDIFLLAISFLLLFDVTRKEIKLEK
jgi:hypothetical protein